MNIYKKAFIALLPSIPLYIWGVYLVTSDPVHIFWFLAYFYFVLTLAVSPLWYIFTKILSLKKYNNSLVSLRRQLWVFTGIFALLHTINFYETVLWFYEKFFASSQSLWEFIIIGLSGVQWNVFWMNILSFWFWTLWIIVMLCLLITSNKYSQKVLGVKNWKRLQQCAYPLFLIMVAHIYFIWWWKGAYLYPAILLVVLRVYTWFDKNYEKKWGITNSTSGYRRYLCVPCGYIYDEELWDPDWWLKPGTKYEDIPDDWVCPVCWAAKKDFVPLDNHFNPKENENHELVWKVHKKKYLTKDVIELQVFLDQNIHILPWQFCNIMVQNKNGDTYMRSYSVASYTNGIITFLIKLKDWGIAWEYLKGLEEWENISLLWPFGDFVIQHTTKKKIFVATGTGLSPIYNMMHASWDSEKILYFWVRNQDDLFYLSELNNIPNLTIHIYLSQQEQSSYNFWRIKYENIEYKKDDEIYLCWNPQLIEELQICFENDDMNVFSEKFL